MDPLRSESGLPESLSDAERDARIEQLLLAGLDEYFAGQYEHAVNLWTRVLFLDRHHDRARAYIERARRAEAERQRETDALLQEGIAAFQGGDVERARRLITDALDRGAAREDAQGMLDRIDRLGTGQTAPRRRRLAATMARAGEIDPSGPAPRRAGGLVAAGLLVAAALGALAVGVLGLSPLDPASWPLADVANPQSATAVSGLPMESLPMVGANDAYLARGRVLLATGRLHDALAVLDRVPVGSPQYAEAQTVRVAVQRELLALAAAELSSPGAPASVGPPVPE